MEELKQIGIDLDVNRVIEANRNSFTESENTVLRRLLKLDDAAKSDGKDAYVHAPRETLSRSTNAWIVGVGKQVRAANSLIDAYKTLLLVLAKRDAGFLEAFSKEGTWARRFVSKTPQSLYINSPKLSGHAQPLTDGWYYDTNLSELQIRKRAEIAARLVGLNFETDITFEEGDEIA